jgi:cytochrome c553
MRELFSFRNPHFVTAVTITVTVFILAALGGFVVLPSAQRGQSFDGLWDMICSAAGLPRATSSGEAQKAPFKISNAVLTSTTMAHPTQQSIGRGATLAQRCAICHGPTGISQADSPNLAGQYASVIYKQLLDFRSGARTNAVMTPFATSLSDQDIADLAAYYAYLRRLPGYHPELEIALPRIVIYGAPLRGIAPCGACHGSLDNKTGSPWLEGQSAAYMKAQLQAFASGERHNDINEQMRNVARAMTPQEIEDAAAYYASQPPEIVKTTE